MARPLAEWHLPSSVTLGSTVRAKGIERVIRRRLPWSTRKCLTVETGKVILHMLGAEAAEFDALFAIGADMLTGIAELPILPSEAEDILSTHLASGTSGWTTAAFKAQAPRQSSCVVEPRP